MNGYAYAWWAFGSVTVILSCFMAGVFAMAFQKHPRMLRVGDFAMTKVCPFALLSAALCILTFVGDLIATIATFK